MSTNTESIWKIIRHAQKFVASVTEIKYVFLLDKKLIFPTINKLNSSCKWVSESIENKRGEQADLDRVPYPYYLDKYPNSI